MSIRYFSLAIIKTFLIILHPQKIEALKDASGDTCFYKVMEHLQPRFEDTEAGQQSLWEWQAACMRNYMNYLILHHGYKPKYYDPYVCKKDQVKEIHAHHIARFYGVMMARVFSSNTSIDTIFSVCKCFELVSCVKEAITQDTYKDLYQMYALCW